MIEQHHKENNTAPVFNKSLHFKFWDFLSKNPGLSKRDVLNINSNYFQLSEVLVLSQATHSCLACDYAMKLNQFLNAGKFSKPSCKNNCQYCPFLQKERKISQAEDCLNGVFLAWVKSTDLIRSSSATNSQYRKTSLLAQSIRDWEVKPSVRLN